ncbi:MAG: 4Fe-4S binding protein [Bacteroidales bacterium]|nr:4Fe-4S binding protein [Bacteroidales bacterium]
MKNLHGLSGIRALSFLLAVALAVPVSWKGLTGFYTWLSPYIMLNSLFSLKSLVWLNIVAFLVLIFILFRKRWFCHHLCPVGWCCDIVSGLNKRTVFSYKCLPDINKWLAILSIAAALFGLPLFIFLDPLAVFNGFFTVFSGRLSIIAIISLLGFPLLLLTHLFFPGLWCARICPLGGLQLIMTDVKNLVDKLFSKKEEEPLPIGVGRRYFLMSGIGLLGGAMIPRFLKPPEEKNIRPPAAVAPVLFNSLCCRCGNCIKACPTGIIYPETDSDNLLGWMTPAISFKSGYCLETCNKCGTVCSSGAITIFSVKAKSQLFIGTAEVHLENCLLVNNKECIKCRESCKYDALKLVPEKNMLNAVPVVDTDKCVGCGACEVICPENCIKIKP